MTTTEVANPMVRLAVGLDHEDGLTKITQWSGLSHIPGVADGSLAGVPDYADKRDRPRLAAYIALRALMESCRRRLLLDEPSTDHREFGDPAMFVERISSAMVGDGLRVSVKGADRSIPASPEIPPPPPEPATREETEGDDPIPALEARLQRLIYERSAEDWFRQAEAITEEWATQLELQPRLEARQRWVRDWASPVMADLIGRIVEAENENIVPLGDGVYTLGWDPDNDRVEVRIVQPDHYFPVLDGDEGLKESPSVVHLCWPESRYEEKSDGSLEEVEYVTRTTYELIPVDPEHPDHDPGLDYSFRRESDQKHLCFYSKGTWPKEDFKNVYTPDFDQVEWDEIPDPDSETGFVVANRVSIGYKFNPLEHVSHTLSRGTHFGRSPLARVAQLADELAKADTGRALAAAWAADPMTVLKGLQAGAYDLTPEKTLKLKPGAGFAAEADGGVEVVDMAAQLDGLGRYTESLIDRLATVMGIPKGLIGRIDAAEIPSGIALALLFTAFDQVIMQGHMARDSKMPRLLDKVQYMALYHGDPHMEDDPTIHPAFIEWGPYMPSDITALANVIKLLSDAGKLSTSAAITALQAAGFLDGDHAVELAAQREEDGDLIEAYADALGGKFAARLAGVTDWTPPEPDVDQLGQVGPLNEPPEEE